jgi:hypothetical protein
MRKCARRDNPRGRFSFYNTFVAALDRFGEDELLMDLEVYKLESELPNTVHNDMDRTALSGGWANWRSVACYEY